MTIEQITAINNGMSMLADIAQYAGTTNSLDAFKEYTGRHVKALKDSGVHEYIVEHFESLINSWIPIARQSEADCIRWEDLRKETYEMEIEEAKRTCWDTSVTKSNITEADLIALQELKAKLGYN